MFGEGAEAASKEPEGGGGIPFDEFLDMFVYFCRRASKSTSHIVRGRLLTFERLRFVLV